MSHTPGPWQADGQRVWANAGDPVYIASLKFANDSEMTIEEKEANTRLIAAAPDLLAACEVLISHYMAKNKDFCPSNGICSREDCAVCGRVLDMCDAVNNAREGDES